MAEIIDGYMKDVVKSGTGTRAQVSGLTIGTAQDLLHIRLTDGREALIPFVEALVPTVDLDAGRVVVDPPHGLLDLAE